MALRVQQRALEQHAVVLDGVGLVPSLLALAGAGRHERVAARGELGEPEQLRPGGSSDACRTLQPRPDSTPSR